MIKEQQQRLSIGSHYSGSVIPLGNNSGIFDELFDDLLQYEEQEVQGEYEKSFLYQLQIGKRIHLFGGK